MEKFAALLLLTASLAGCSLPAEFSSFPPNGGESSISQGSAFGVTVGEDRDAAHDNILRDYAKFKFSYSTCLMPGGQTGTTSFGKYGPMDCHGAEIEDLYHDGNGPSIKAANIIIMSKDGYVTRIVWNSIQTYFG